MRQLQTATPCVGHSYELAMMLKYVRSTRRVRCMAAMLRGPFPVQHDPIQQISTHVQPSHVHAKLPHAHAQSPSCTRTIPPMQVHPDGALALSASR